MKQILVLNHGERYPICPRCGCMLTREYMRFCDCCGQKLEWSSFNYERIVNTNIVTDNENHNRNKDNRHMMSLNRDIIDILSR